MISVNRLKNDQQFVNGCSGILLVAVIAVVIIPFAILKFIMPFLWLILAFPWVVFVGHEFYQMLKVKYSDVNNGMIRSILLGSKPDLGYFRGQRKNLLVGNILPLGFHVAFALMTLSLSFGVIISFIIGIGLFLGHLKLRDNFCKMLNQPV